MGGVRARETLSEPVTVLGKSVSKIWGQCSPHGAMFSMCDSASVGVLVEADIQWEDALPADNATAEAKLRLFEEIIAELCRGEVRQGLFVSAP